MGRSRMERMRFCRQRCGFELIVHRFLEVFGAYDMYISICTGGRKVLIHYILISNGNEILDSDI